MTQPNFGQKICLQIKTEQTDQFMKPATVVKTLFKLCLTLLQQVTKERSGSRVLRVALELPDRSDREVSLDHWALKVQAVQQVCRVNLEVQGYLEHKDLQELQVRTKLLHFSVNFTRNPDKSSSRPYLQLCLNFLLTLTSIEKKSSQNNLQEWK